MKPLGHCLLLLCLTLVHLPPGRTPAESSAEELPTIQTSTVSADTVYLYGGAGTLEGRFETATGEADWQNWRTIDRTNRASWQSSTFNAINLNSVSGNHAMWAGRTALQAPSWETAPGYGNNVDESLYWIHAVDNPALASEVRLRFRYNHELEPEYDFFSVMWDSAGTWQTVLQVDGSNRDSSGAFLEPALFDRSFTYPPASYGGLMTDEIRLRLRVTTDGGWSDEDGLFDSEGAVQIDDIEVWIDGALMSLADFEPDGSDGGWVAHDAQAAGDYAKILTGFDDEGLDPLRDNTTPALTIVDDGTPPRNDPTAVPSAGTTSNWTYGFPGGWVVPLNLALSIRVQSPIIPWSVDHDPDDNLDAAFVRADVWSHTDYFRNFNYAGLAVRSRPDPVNGGWSDWNSGGGLLGAAPAWDTATIEVGHLLVPEPDSLQIAIDLGGYCLQFCSLPRFTPAPVVDNIQVARYRSPPVPVPATRWEVALRSNHPNPFNPQTRLRFEIPSRANVALDIYDPRGARVRRLIEGTIDAGQHEVSWDGRNDRGVAVVSGIYIVRLEALGVRLGRKIALLR